MINAKIYTNDLAHSTEALYETFADALTAMHPDASVWWDRDMPNFELPSDRLRIEIVNDEKFPALWGFGNVCWGEFMASNHARLVADPVVGPRWIIVETEEWNNYAQCVRILGLTQTTNPLTMNGE